MAAVRDDQAPVTVGRIGRSFGVRGWVHVRSDMSPPQALLEHDPWLLASAGGGGGEPRRVLAARRHGNGIVALLEGCTDREGAEALRSREIMLPRSVFPEPEPEEFYWVDLLGLEVVSASGVCRGRVHGLMETGAHDVLVVRNEAGGEAGEEELIPFVVGAVVKEVDTAGGRIVVDWDGEG